MTLHIVYDHQCTQCSAFYIPFEENVHCPQCGKLENETFDFIPRAVDSLNFNKTKWGSFTPSAWWVGSFGDHVLNILFTLFDDYDQSGREDFDEFASDHLSELDWGEQTYLEEHIKSISKLIYPNLNSVILTQM